MAKPRFTRRSMPQRRKKNTKTRSLTTHLQPNRIACANDATSQLTQSQGCMCSRGRPIQSTSATKNMDEHAKIGTKKKYVGKENKEESKAMHPPMKSHSMHAFFVLHVFYLLCSRAIFELALPLKLHMNGLFVSDENVSPTYIRTKVIGHDRLLPCVEEITSHNILSRRSIF